MWITVREAEQFIKPFKKLFARVHITAHLCNQRLVRPA
jgi:hypothetical protein